MTTAQASRSPLRTDRARQAALGRFVLGRFFLVTAGVHLGRAAQERR